MISSLLVVKLEQIIITGSSECKYTELFKSVVNRKWNMDSVPLVWMIKPSVVFFFECVSE